MQEMEMRMNDLVALNTMRQGFYEFLASVYKLELTDAQIETLAAREFPTDDPFVGKGYAAIKEYLRHRNSGTRQELAVDYAYMFLGAGTYEQIIAPPYESVYTSENHLFMQDARDAALKHYRSEDLDLPADNTTPEDHLSFEMQFMAKLIERGNSALAAGDYVRYGELCVKQRAFFDEHLNNWVPQLCSDIRGHAKTKFYDGIADVTSGFLEMENGLIEELAQAA